MGKRLEDLDLSDDPIPGPQTVPARVEARDTDAVRLFLDEIDELRGSGEVDWADATLRGIATTVTETWRVTEGQARAVANIAAARRRGGGRASTGYYSRRYEGWQR